MRQRSWSHDIVWGIYVLNSIVYAMKKILILACAAFLVIACEKKNDAKPIVEQIEENVSDSTLYGVCGKGTMMHTLELITNMEDTLQILINDDESDQATFVEGGMMCGDRMAVTAYKTDEGWVASRIINMTSLLGKWGSIDKNFELTEDGEVKSSVKLESNTWTSWRILNGHLMLNRDTFDIVSLSGDSLEIENSLGIYAFKRLRDVNKTDTLRTKL